MNRLKPKEIKLDVSGLIYIAFAIYAVRFAYMYVNRPYIPSTTFASAMMTESINNVLTDLMLHAVIVCFLVATLLSGFRKIKVNSGTVSVGILIIFGFIWTGISLLDVSYIRLFVVSPTPTVLLLAVCVLLGFFDKAWNAVLNAAFLFVPAFIAVSLADLIKFVSEYGILVRLMASGAVYGLVTSVMFMYVTLLMNENAVRKHKVILFLEIITMLVIAIMLQSRSWIVHVLILLVVYIYRVSKISPNRFLTWFGVVFLVVGLFVVSWEWLTLISEGLLSRLETDSRTEQLKSFFDQVTFTDLLIGKGINASYICWGIRYQYLDNLVLLNMFKFGTVPTIAYLFLLLRPICYGITHKKSPVRSSVLFLLAWLAAMLGISIYVSLSNNIYNIVIYIVIGRMLHLIDQEKRGEVSVCKKSH